MCVSPVRIPNSNRGLTNALARATSDTYSVYINVPCGVCDECIARKQSDIVQRVRVLSLDHYIFFFTLTYNNESLPHVACSNGYSIAYADHTDIVNMFKRIRKADLFGYPFLYITVSERGKTNGRPHFHGLIFVKKEFSNGDPLFTARLEHTIRSTLFKEWRRNYGSTRNPVWKPLFTYRSKYFAGVRYSNFDCHFVVPFATENGSNDVAFYVTKYILKPSDKEKRLQQALRLNLVTYDKDGRPDFSEYESIWQIVKSRCTKSLNFGAATPREIGFIRSQIVSSKDDPNGLHFKNSDGSTAPLPRYYKRFVSSEVAISSVAARGGPLAIRDRSSGDIANSLAKGEIRRQKVSARDISDLTTNFD